MDRAKRILEMEHKRSYSGDPKFFTSLLEYLRLTKTLPFRGLCNTINFWMSEGPFERNSKEHAILKMFIPQNDLVKFYPFNFWAYDFDFDVLQSFVVQDVLFKFTKTREEILIWCAVINGEI